MQETTWTAIGDYSISNDLILKNKRANYSVSLKDGKPRLPYYGIRPSTFEHLPEYYKTFMLKKYETLITEGDIDFKTFEEMFGFKMYFVFWYNKDEDNFGNIEEIAFDSENDAKLLHHIYHTFLSSGVANIIKQSKELYEELQSGPKIN